jgi:ribosome-associated toxin RatA of RatAB toxin-antitoxin module
VYVQGFLPLILLAQLAAEPSPSAPPTAPCIACRVDLAQIRSSYAEADWQALLQGKVVVTKLGDSHSAGAVQTTNEASAIIPYPPAQVWSVVTDFESRPQYVPGAKEAHIVRREGNRLWIDEHLRILLINVRFTVISTVDPEQGSVTWVLDHSAKNDIADTTGSWTVVPLRDGKETLVRYRTWVDSGRSVPRLAEEFLAKRSLPKIVEGLRAEVRRRFPLLRAAPLGDHRED